MATAMFQLIRFHIVENRLQLFWIHIDTWKFFSSFCSEFVRKIIFKLFKKLRFSALLGNTERDFFHRMRGRHLQQGGGGRRRRGYKYRTACSPLGCGALQKIMQTSDNEIVTRRTYTRQGTLALRLLAVRQVGLVQVTGRDEFCCIVLKKKRARTNAGPRACPRPCTKHHLHCWVLSIDNEHNATQGPRELHAILHLPHHNITTALPPPPPSSPPRS